MSGKGDCGAAGSKARNRCNHLTAPKWPPINGCSDGSEAIMFATKEIKPSVRDKKRSKDSKRPSLSRIMPNCSMNASSLLSSSADAGNTGIAVGHIV
jgi:hypothetical protein